MTTSIGNNSVFRSFFEKQKLTRPNFIEWYRQLRIVLSVEDKENYLEHPTPVAAPGQQVPPQALATHGTWVKGLKKIVALILMTMDLDIQRNLTHLGAYDMLQELKTMFDQQVEQELLQIVREFHACKQEEGQSVSSYVLKMKSYIENLERLGQPVSLRLAGNQGKGKAKMGNALVPAPSFAPKPKNPSTPKEDYPAKDAICHQCGEGLQGSRKLKPGALSLYMGDGHRSAVEAIGEFHSCLPSGLVLILHNCHYTPSITRGIISVSRLYDDGFVNRFDGNVLSVSRNNLVYFSVIPRDGIYETDLSSSNTNDSSIKKRIEKLQHDELLNSTDIKSFEKCVSCMSGKMARKPYSHQVERAKDLLGLIHTDVCGPFRTVSRQGASYFVTFTDDFSRYGYVYFANEHKHEVFETLENIHKEVRKSTREDHKVTTF
ncbi:zinc finger, CCHC-type containing protein [Tanacetum coccineum]|uniref:Zinc finger, CCHC-type containing protein n=1 Tax=Tanacetum coccineum TaxID=301880 RepID=A0ABQ5DD27_9ASTR